MKKEEKWKVTIKSRKARQNNDERVAPDGILIPTNDYSFLLLQFIYIKTYRLRLNIASYFKIYITRQASNLKWVKLLTSVNTQLVKNYWALT